MNIAHLLERTARTSLAEPAIAHGRKILATYGELSRHAASLAGGLRRQFSSGDRVALTMKNCPEYVPALFACWRAGLVVVPINAKLHPRELAYILEDSGAVTVIATPEIANAAAEAASSSSHRPTVVEIGSRAWRELAASSPLPEISAAEPGDPAWLFYTSGTTGRPKGAVLSHRNLMAMTLSYLAELGHITQGGGLLHAAPMSHGSGLYILPFVAGAGRHIVPESGRFEPEEIFELALAHRNVSMFAAPTMIRRLTRATPPAHWDPSAFETLIYGGGPMYVEDCRAALDAFGPRLAQIYGQGESPMTITVLPKRVLADRTHPRFEERIASVGFAQVVVEVRAVDRDDRPVALGEPGEIVVRGDTVMAGYWRRPEATAETLRGGWLRTGDVGSFDAEGFLTLKDRAKDVIISGGSNIYPREVEEVLLHHPEVGEAAVVGRPDPEWGEEVIAFIVSAAGTVPSRESLDAHCAAHIARFKRPRQYLFVSTLPKNEYGKILKSELRKLLSDPVQRSIGPTSRLDP